MLPHRLTIFEITKQVLSKWTEILMVFIQEIVFLLGNLGEYKSLGTRWIVLYANGNNKIASYNAIYFNSFGVEHIPKEVKKFIGNRNVITNIYRIQAFKSIMRWYFSIGFIDFELK